MWISVICMVMMMNIGLYYKCDKEARMSISYVYRCHHHASDWRCSRCSFPTPRQYNWCMLCCILQSSICFKIYFLEKNNLEFHYNFFTWLGSTKTLTLPVIVTLQSQYYSLNSECGFCQENENVETRLNITDADKRSLIVLTILTFGAWLLVCLAFVYI